MTIDANVAALLARSSTAQPASLEELRSETDQALIAMQLTIHQLCRP